MQTTDLTLDTVANGAVPEKFAHALKGVVQNILDPNCSAKAKRSITITLTFKPAENDPSYVQATASVIAQLAPPKGDSGQVYLGTRGGELVAVTHDPRQQGLFDTQDETETDDKVRPIKAKAQEAS